MKFQFDDGGRKDAGYKGDTGDCVCRSIAIASGVPYQQVYERLAEGNASQRLGKYEAKAMRLKPSPSANRLKEKVKKSRAKSAATGINVRRKWFKDYMKSLGFDWVATMQIGQGCKVHLTDGELPNGRLVVQVSKHYTAVIDGVIHDTYNPDRDGNRCVYGYFIKK